MKSPLNTLSTLSERLTEGRKLIFSIRRSLNKKELGRLKLFVFILMNLPGLWFTSLAAQGLKIRYHLDQDGRVETSARIVDYDKWRVGDRGSQSRGRTSYIPVLEFEDPNGQTVRTKVAFLEYSSKTMPEIGSLIQIVHSAKNPEIVQKKDPTDGLEDVIIGLVSGVFFLIMASVATFAISRFFIVKPIPNSQINLFSS